MPNSSTVHWFHSALHISPNVHDQSCQLSVTGSVTRSSPSCSECGIHGQKNTNPANLQRCCSIEVETGFVPTSAQFFRCRHLFDSEVSFLNSFLYRKVPRVNVFRSLSCSQSIRQRIRRRAVTLYFNLHRNSQILVKRSQGQSNLTFFHHSVKLRLSSSHLRLTC